MKQRIKTGLFMFALTSILCGCGEEDFLRRSDLVNPQLIYTNLSIDIDWLTKYGDLPTGMTIYTFGKNTGTQYELSADVNTIDLYRNADSYKVMVFSLTPSEYGSLHFEDLDNSQKAAAMLNRYECTDGWNQGTTYQYEPEKIGASVDTLDLTPQMVEKTLCWQLAHKNCQECLEGDTTKAIFKALPISITKEFTIKVRIKGIKYAKSVVGEISGLADGWMLALEHATETTGINRLNEWIANVKTSDDKDGWITKTITTFGLPYGNDIAGNRNDSDNVLKLYFELVDGKTTISYSYNVGNMIKYSEDGNLILIIDTDISESQPMPNLPKVEPKGNDNGGINAHVGDWGNGGDVIMPA
jgi:hypothetical protein